MSDVDKLRLWEAAQHLTNVLGDIVITATATSDPGLAQIASVYRNALVDLEDHFVVWVETPTPKLVQPLVGRLTETMGSAFDLYQSRNLRGALQQTHAALSALPGLPDFPPLQIPPVPGSDF